MSKSLAQEFLEKNVDENLAGGDGNNLFNSASDNDVNKLMLSGIQFGSPTFGINAPSPNGEYAGVNDYLVSGFMGKDVQEMLDYTQGKNPDVYTLESLTMALRSRGFHKSAELVEAIQKNPEDSDVAVLQEMSKELRSLGTFNKKTCDALYEFSLDVKTHLLLESQGINSNDVMSGKVVLTEDVKKSVLTQING